MYGVYLLYTVKVTAWDGCASAARSLLQPCPADPQGAAHAHSASVRPTECGDSALSTGDHSIGGVIFV